MMYILHICLVSLVFQLVSAECETREMSSECRAQMAAYGNGLLNNSSWAWNMFDANPKFPYGILTGNLLEAGNYDQCMSIRHNGEEGQILGKFCMAAVAVGLPVYLTMDGELESRAKRWTEKHDTSFSFRSSLPIREENGSRLVVLSLCVPDACKPEEILDSLYITSIGLPIFALSDPSCETVEDLNNISGADIAFIVFSGVIIALAVGCTVYDELIRDKTKRTNPLFIAFSVTTNFKKISQLSNDANRIACLDGLRVFSILWVILGHRYSISTVIPWVNSDALDHWQVQTYSQFAQGAAAAVDTFMYLTGFLMAMSFIRTQSKPNARFNVILYYIHRYLRITPAMAVVYFMHVSVFVHFGSGPYWTMLTQRTRQNCLDRWASFFFYFQNYLDHNNMCLMHTWYLSMDMQIFILSPLVLLPLVKFRKIMMKIGMPILVALSMITPFVITYVYETQIMTDEYFWYYYYPTHTRLSSWLIGVYTGAIIYAYKDAKLDIRPLLNIFIWAVVVVGMIACVFCGNYITYNYNRLATSFYLTFHRPGWCIGLAWIIFACMKGRGGIFNYVLSADLFQSLSKITYSMYLVHASCLVWNIARIRYPSHFGDFENIHFFLGDILTSMTFAFIWCVLFESPVVVAEKVIFGAGGGKSKPAEKKILEDDLPNGNNVSPIEDKIAEANNFAYDNNITTMEEKINEENDLPNGDKITTAEDNIKLEDDLPEVKVINSKL